MGDRGLHSEMPRAFPEVYGGGAFSLFSAIWMTRRSVMCEISKLDHPRSLMIGSSLTRSLMLSSVIVPSSNHLCHEGRGRYLTSFQHMPVTIAIGFVANRASNLN